MTCQDESSQHKNRAAALKVLKARLLASEQQKAAAEREQKEKVWFQLETGLQK